MKRDFDWWKKNKLTTEQFEKLDPAAQRVYIARDVLAQLQCGQVKAQTGVYLRNEHIDKWLSQGQLEQDLRQVLGDEPCTACAIGSVFACAVRVADKAPARRFARSDGMLSIGDEKMREYLDRFFSREQQAMMEAAFEGVDISDHMRDAGVLFRTRRAAERYNDDADGGRVALTRIMRNIIRNGGDFNPLDTTRAAR